MIIVSMDDNQVMTNLQNLATAVDQGVPKQALDIGFEILRLSQFEVPHDEGTLQNSGTVEEVDGDVVIGYHTKYAARLHEHPEYRFKKGRKGKYLEDPIVKNENALGIRFAKGMDDVIGGSIR